jgi:Omp85 superfamily domain
MHCTSKFLAAAKRASTAALTVSLMSVLLGLVCSTSVLAADAERGLFSDPTDGKLDASEWLLDKKGFLPVPIIITEPAVGYGGGIAFMFFRESLRTAAVEAEETGGHVIPPDIFGAALAATENGTKFGGVGGMFSFDNDRWRYRGGVGNANVNLDFYGAGNSAAPKVGYNIDGWISSHTVLRQIAGGNNFVALRWFYLDINNTLDTQLQQPPLLASSHAVRSSGLALGFEHDSRDNIVTPSRGWFAAVDSTFFSPAIGSDNTFEIYKARTFIYLNINRQLIIGGRLDGRAARGDVPLFELPFIDMRGIPAVRYQDINVGVAETELRWNVSPRWAAIGFVGAGRAWGTRDSFGETETVIGKGVGFRYLVARRLGLYAGVDVAQGPEENAIYLTIGSAWR